MATPREEQEAPVIYKIQSEGGDSWIYDDHYKINVVSYSLFHDSKVEETFDDFILEICLPLHGEGEAIQKPKHKTTFTTDSPWSSRTWQRTWTSS